MFLYSLVGYIIIFIIIFIFIFIIIFLFLFIFIFYFLFFILFFIKILLSVGNSDTNPKRNMGIEGFKKCILGYEIKEEVLDYFYVNVSLQPTFYTEQNLEEVIYEKFCGSNKKKKLKKKKLKKKIKKSLKFKI